MSSSGKDSVVTLGGRQFKRTKSGLDEAQIAAFIEELIRERDSLAKSQHHIASLTKLAETTIVEADRLANQIKTDAAEQAKAESTAIIDKAKEQAQQMAQEKQAEVLEAANQQASAIRAEAEREAASLLEKETANVRDAVRNTVSQHFGYLLDELERLKQQAAAAQADFESDSSRSAEKSSAVAVGWEGYGGGQRMEAQEAPGAAIMQLQEELSAAPTKQAKAVDEYPQPTQVAQQQEKSFDLSRLLEIEDHAELGEPQFEVEILPPVHMRKMMEVVAYLDELPEVENTEIIPRVDMPAILVFLREETNFVDVLRTTPGVAYVEEVMADADSTNGEQAKGPKKLRISLSGNTTPQQQQ
ncbi:MAG: hypothetical protein ACLFVD_03500 [Dehalococcoidia bacterium]